MEISPRKCTAMLLLLALAFSTTVQAEDSGVVSVPPINTPATSQQLPGKIIWHDLVTTNVSASQRFYADLFGWQYNAYVLGNETYYVISHRGKPVGGIVPLTAQQAAGNDNQWVSYISVPDVAQATGFVKENGGKVLLEPMKFRQQGELAVFTDPEGAVFGVLNSTSGDPADGRSQAGEWGWADLLAKDPQRAINFYQGIADYSAKKYAKGSPGDDFYLLTGKVPRAGVATIPAGKQAPEILPNWLPYILVSDVNAAVVQTPKLGGRVILNPASQVYNGRLAVIADPGGAVLGLIELKLKNKH